MNPLISVAELTHNILSAARLPPDALRRPFALRPGLATGLPFSRMKRLQAINTMHGKKCSIVLGWRRLTHFQPLIAYDTEVPPFGQVHRRAMRRRNLLAGAVSQTAHFKADTFVSYLYLELRSDFPIVKSFFMLSD
jgi:hypothetical protein